MKVFKAKSILGAGSNGIVFDVGHCALKKVICSKRDYDGVRNLRENDMLIKVKEHPLCIDLLDIYQEDPMEPFDYKEELRGEVESKTHIAIEKGESCRTGDFNIKKILLDSLLALEYLHSRGIIHGDIKPDNIVMVDGVAKLIDFGLAFYKCRQELKSYILITCNYRPPEIYLRRDYNEKVDIWALACSLYEIMAGRPLFSGEDESVLKHMNRYVPFTEKERKLIDSYYSVALPAGKKRVLAHELIPHMLKKRVSERYNATQCIDHSYFTEYTEYIIDMRKRFGIFNGLWIDRPIYEWMRPNYDRREAMMNRVLRVYSKRNSYRWYRHIILFHVIEMIDRIGLAGGIEEEELWFASCVNMAVKYFSINDEFKVLDDLGVNREECERVEERALLILDNEIFRETKYEAAKTLLSEEMVEELINSHV